MSPSSLLSSSGPRLWAAVLLTLQLACAGAPPSRPAASPPATPSAAAPVEEAPPAPTPVAAEPAPAAAAPVEPSPPEAPAAEAPVAAAPVAAAPKEAGPTRVLLIGDSFIVSEFGTTLEAALGETGRYDVLRKGKSSSGLARPDFFDWWEQGRQLAERHQPHVVVLMMGGNDGQSLIGAGLKRPVRWLSKEWPETYRERMRSLMKTLEAPGRRLVWLELPPMEVPRFDRKVESIRRLQREVVAGVPGAEYLETRALLHSPRGALLRQVPGRKSRVRQADGIHFTSEGGRYFALQVAPLLRERLERMEAAVSSAAAP